MKSPKHSIKSGTLPGHIVHVGERRKTDALMTWVHIKDQVIKKKTIQLASLETVVKSAQTSVQWVIIEGLHDVELLSSIGQKLHLDAVVVENIANTYERSSIQEIRGNTQAVLRFVFLNGNKLTSEQVTILQRGNLVLSFYEDGLEHMPGLQTRLSQIDLRVERLGGAYLLYSLMDSIIDGYYVVVENMEEQIDLLEIELMHRPEKKQLFKIQRLRKNFTELHKNLWSFKESLGSHINKTEWGHNEELQLYYSDLLEHVIHLEEQVSQNRDALSDLLELYLSSANKHQSDTMQFLALISTIFMPLTFIVGVYGMNFRFMPELKWYYGYPIVLAVLGAIAIGQYLWFKKKKWL